MSTHWLITDIWGQHATLDPFLRRLEAIAPDWQVLDPYSGQRFAFEDETQAYQYFLHRCSKATYQQKLEAVLEQAQQPLTLLACSAGANALWPLLDGPLASKIRKAVLVYGSTIPEQPITPRCDTALLLCRGDNGVTEHQERLAQHSTLLLSDAPHGFLNPRAPGYHPDAAAEAEAWLQQQLTR
ncbi:hypothetical protein [Ferrimonas balearica]|uniref:hypothetical protein n=1 Tax=Ferrimonas balearica TaxID=44012 RepID=UPI001C55F1DB|nr:hypothetical protein [Ferrimonas balearica]MBW3165511.1 hypothetical protein [Ferrimonas balearica]MBY6226666.1 hypothetical protein [Ferrimonas balearica]